MLALTTKEIQFFDVNQAEIVVPVGSFIEVMPEREEDGSYIADFYGILFTIEQCEFGVFC